jgi:sec-independent protein translocase protein TatB
MFDIGWSEMLVVGAVALVVIGPKDLPAALRQAGKWMGSVRRMAADFQGQVNQAMREAELDELRREVSDLKSGFNTVTDPVRSAGQEVKSLVESPAALPAPQPKAGKPKPEPASPKPKPKRAPKKKTEPKP